MYAACHPFGSPARMDRILATLMDASDVERTLDRMAMQIAELLTDTQTSGAWGLVGMQTRGVPLARRLAERLQRAEGVDVPVGLLDATMYRDDVRMRLRQPVVRRTEIPFDLHGRNIVLVDDVLYTGRSARAALDALLDLGRPASVHFVVMIDRGLRELPVQADIIGRVVPTLPGQEVRVRLSEVDEREGVWLVDVLPNR